MKASHRAFVPDVSWTGYCCCNSVVVIFGISWTIWDVWRKSVSASKRSLLSSSCRVRPLSESVNDLFREVSMLHRRITELSHRLATLEPFLRHHGYRGEDGREEEAGGSRAHGLRGEMASLARYTPRTAVRASVPRGSRVVRRRRVRVLKKGGVKLVQGDR